MGSDLYTLLQLRDDIYAQYLSAKDRKREWTSGLRESLRLIESKIQEEMDSRDEYAIQEEGQ
jgi:hypothetical protein